MTQALAYPLEARDVSLRRGGSPVLHDIDVRFPAGSVTTIVGPSGSGKTSLLRCFNGLERPEEGQVFLDGEPVVDIEPSQLRRRVGMIFQTPILFEGGVRANLCYALDGVEEDRLCGALDRAGLERSFLERTSSALSVGQAQRVCIARALVRDPEVLLFDEPTSALDRDAASLVESSIRELAQAGLTAVVVTHDLAQARRIADTAYLLVAGRIVVGGDIDSVEASWPSNGSA